MTMSMKLFRITSFIIMGISSFAMAMAASRAARASDDWNETPSWAAPTDDSYGVQHKYVNQKQLHLSPFSPGSHNLAIDLGQVFLMGDLSHNYSDAIGSQ